MNVVGDEGGSCLAVDPKVYLALGLFDNAHLEESLAEVGLFDPDGDRVV